MCSRRHEENHLGVVKRIEKLTQRVFITFRGKFSLFFIPENIFSFRFVHSRRAIFISGIDCGTKCPHDFLSGEKRKKH